MFTYTQRLLTMKCNRLLQLLKRNRVVLMEIDFEHDVQTSILSEKAFPLKQRRRLNTNKSIDQHARRENLFSFIGKNVQ